MGNKLYKYNGFDSSSNTILSGYELNDAYLWDEETILSGYTGYTNITSITTLDSVGPTVGLRHCDIRKEIKNLYNTQTGTTWSAYTTNEKTVLSKYFIVDKTKRDEVLTNEEQDEYNHYKLYDFLSDDAFESMGSVNTKTTPKSVDYKKDLSVRLHPEFGFDKFGFLTGCTYYENITITYDQYGFTVFTYDNPVVDYKANYTFADNGYVATRTVTRKWYKMDGTLSDNSKTTFKVYEPMVARDEARRRRKNLINNLLIQTVGLIIMTSNDLSNVSEAEADAMELMKDINSAISAYYEYGTKVDAQGNPCQLIQEISVHPYVRLDNFVPGTNDTVTIRMFILNALNPQ